MQDQATSEHNINNAELRTAFVWYTTGAQRSGMPVAAGPGRVRVRVRGTTAAALAQPPTDVRLQ